MHGSPQETRVVSVVDSPRGPVQRFIGVARRSAPIRRAGVAAVRASRPVRLRRRTPLLATRAELPVLLNLRGLLGRGVELGVKQGFYSEELLSTWRGRELVSIDPWLAQAEDEYRDTDNVAQDEHDRFHRETVERLARFGDRSSIWRMTGEAAAPRIPDGSLDFVYLDARHDEDSVRADLEQWRPKVRAGGVLAGHDYVDGLFEEGEFGVKSAVDGFFAGTGLRVHATFADPWVTWFVLLPGPSA